MRGFLTGLVLAAFVLSLFPFGASAATAVRLSELMANPPTGATEWVALANPSSTGERLDGWTIYDGHGEIARLAGLIAPWGRVVVSHFSGHLNDGGDLVMLKDAGGSVVDAVSFGHWPKGDYAHVRGAPKRGETLARTERGTWAFIAQSTLGATNVTETFSGTGTPQQSPPTKVPKAKIKNATKPVSKPRYKGEAGEAVVAVPLGVYGKTRMFVTIDGALRELRLSNAPADAPAAGAHVTFIAQEKTDGATSYLSANAKTLALAEATDEAPVFAPSDVWPTDGGPVNLTASVVTATPQLATVSASGTQGAIALPSAAKLNLKPGDQISVLGYVTNVGVEPMLYLATPDALTVLTHAADASAPSASRFPPWAAAALTIAALAVGLLAYLRNERLKRLSLVRREGDLPLEE